MATNVDEDEDIWEVSLYILLHHLHYHPHVGQQQLVMKNINNIKNYQK